MGKCLAKRGGRVGGNVHDGQHTKVCGWKVSIEYCVELLNYNLNLTGLVEKVWQWGTGGSRSRRDYTIKNEIRKATRGT